MSPDGSFIVKFPKGPVGGLQLAGDTVKDRFGVASLDSFLGVLADIVFCCVPVHVLEEGHGSLRFTEKR